jgi:peptidoglycan biosynthesis protein MviN/MurJ (putative lipid II flippase)
MVPYMLLGRILSLLELPFFAAQDTRTPLIGSVMTAVVYIGISLGLVRSLGIYALPIGRAFAYTASPLFLAYKLRRRSGKLGFWALRDSASKICAASLVMGILILIGHRVAITAPLHGFAAQALVLAFPSALGTVGLLISLFALGVSDPLMFGKLVPYFSRKS